MDALTMQQLFRETSLGHFEPLETDLVTEDVTIPLSNFQIWNDADCAYYDVYRVDTPEEREGQRIVATHVTRVNGKVIMLADYGAIPEEPKQPDRREILTKAGFSTQQVDALLRVLG